MGSNHIVHDLVNRAKSAKQLDSMWTIGLLTLGFKMVFRTEAEPSIKQGYQWDVAFVYPDTAEFNGKSAKYRAYLICK